MAPKQPLGNPSPVSSSEEEIVEKQEEEKHEEEEDEKDEEKEEEEVVEKEKEEEEPLVNTKKRHAEKPRLPETSKKMRTGLASSRGGASFHQIWSGEDVIAVLEGMIQFKEVKGADPSTNMDGFLEYIKDAIHISVSKNQIKEKIRTLKKKYQNNAKRVQDGKDPVFSKPHDHDTFRLSKLIWASVADKSNNKRKSGKCLDADEFWATYPSLNKWMEVVPPKQRSSARDVMGLARRFKVKEMDDKWHKFNVKELGLNMKRTQLFLDVSRSIGFGQAN